MSILEFVLRSAIPYTPENQLLTYRPRAFFEELENRGLNHRSYSKAHNQAKRTEYLTAAGELTPKGKWRLFKFRLSARGKSLVAADENLVVAYDIPESRRGHRALFRHSLRALSFRPIQQSVWIGDSSLRPEVEVAVAYLHLHGSVRLFERV